MRASAVVIPFVWTRCSYVQACGVCFGYSLLLRYGMTAPNAGLRIKAALNALPRKTGRPFSFSPCELERRPGTVRGSKLRPFGEKRICVFSPPACLEPPGLL